MPKGFVSFLFLMGAASVLVLSSAWPMIAYPSSTGIFFLSSHRLQLEQNVDGLIQEELYLGLLAQLSAEELKSRVNQKIVEYFSRVSARTNEGVSFSPGFSALSVPSYLSLLSQPLRPVSLFQLNQNSHVLILPVSQVAKYAEYSYTGGVFASDVVHVRMFSSDGNTLFALPLGYRSCVTTFQKKWPCVVFPEKDAHAHV